MRIEMKYCEQTEREILNSAIIKQENLFRLMECDRDLFYFVENRNIFDILKELFEAGTHADMSVVGLKLKEQGKFESHEKHLLTILKSYTPYSIDTHIETLERHYNERKLLMLS